MAGAKVERSCVFVFNLPGPFADRLGNLEGLALLGDLRLEVLAGAQIHRPASALVPRHAQLDGLGARGLQVGDGAAVAAALVRCGRQDRQDRKDEGGSREERENAREHAAMLPHRQRARGCPETGDSRLSPKLETGDSRLSPKLETGDSRLSPKLRNSAAAARQAALGGYGHHALGAAG